MKYRRDFEIPHLGLKEGVHLFQFEIDDEFVRLISDEAHDFENLKAIVNLSFDKKSSFYQLHFDIDGSVVVTCDRCGDSYEMKLWDEFDLIIKLVSDNDAQSIENEDDVAFISRSESILDMSEWVYEFLMLSIPMQKIHPLLADGSSGCNEKALELLKKLSDQALPEHTIWKGLKDIKDKKSNN